MKAYEIFQNTDPTLLTQMLDWFRENDRNVYKSAIQSLAQTRKLRLVFLQKKPLADQYAWILKTLKLKQTEAIGEHLLQAWLISGHQDLLATFCDAMKIEHDGKGSVTGDLPEGLDRETLNDAVNQTLEGRDPKIVTLYLRVFNLQRSGGWDSLSEKLGEDERLILA